jgi:hypothetical protein
MATLNNTNVSSESDSEPEYNSDRSEESLELEENLQRVLPYRFEPPAREPRQNRVNNQPLEDRANRLGNTDWYVVVVSIVILDNIHK